MAGCDGSLSSKDCKTCNGTGLKVIPVIDSLSKRLKPTVAACLGKRNETSEAYYPKLKLVPQVKELDIEKIPYGLNNYVFIGDENFVWFSAKKMIVKNYYTPNFRVSIVESNQLITEYVTGKAFLSDYATYDLLILLLNSESDNPIFKSAVLELIKVRCLNDKPLWVHVPAVKGELAKCKEYSPDIDHYTSKFTVVRRSLGSFNGGSDNKVSTSFSSI